MAEVRERLTAASDAGASLLEASVGSPSEIAQFRQRYLAWESRTAAILEASFATTGIMTTSPKDEFTATAISLLDLKLSATTIPVERLDEVFTDVREKVRVLESIEHRLDVYLEVGGRAAPDRRKTSSSNAPIFLVHGRDLARRETVRRFLELTTDRDVVVLAEQPNRGQDLLGKLLVNAQDAAFAVILLTPDDFGGLEGGEAHPRARQNVVFELGMFIGLLGRDRVAALKDSQIELPTDFSGVVYIPIEGESWQVELAREIKAAGIKVSLDEII